MITIKSEVGVLYIEITDNFNNFDNLIKTIKNTEIKDIVISFKNINQIDIKMIQKLNKICKGKILIGDKK